MILRCCWCKRTFGEVKGLAGAYTDGICESCWPALLADWGIPGRPYPGRMTEERAQPAGRQ